jgi:hypothetical protein
MGSDPFMTSKQGTPMINGNPDIEIETETGEVRIEGTDENIANVKDYL